ncbi:MAG: phosphoribosylanthranilate isomerase [Gammaproteobacteria bacterium]
MMVHVKMCGMTRAEDALFAAQLGVHAIGLIFYESSPRAVSISQAKTIIDSLPPFITTVGVFVDPTFEYVQKLLNTISLDLLQFHGQERAADCRRYGKPYIKTIAMRDSLDWSVLDEYTDAKGLLLDTYSAEMVGGTGHVFDWRQIQKQKINKPIILAGGLTPENVAQAIRQVHPYAVDVTTGVEAAKGIKDHNKMQRFMREVRNASVT